MNDDAFSNKGMRRFNLQIKDQSPISCSMDMVDKPVKQTTVFPTIDVDRLDEDRRFAGTSPALS